MTITYAADYYPYGKILREWVPCEPERFFTTQHERDSESGYDNRGARLYDADVGRFLSVDPLAEDFASYSPYNYVLGNPVRLVDPDGKAPEGDYFDYSGNYLGSDGINDNKVYVANSVVLDASSVVTSAENSLLLSADADVFIGFAAMVYEESSGNKTESYAIANATMNFISEGGSTQLSTLEDVVLYDNYFAQGATQDNFDDYVENNRIMSNSRNEFGAVINALAGAANPESRINGHFPDYSNGANSWDGVDLVQSTLSNSHRGYSWSSGSKSIVQAYKTAVNGGVDVSKWTYKDNGAQISALGHAGRTLMTQIHTGRGEKKQNENRFVDRP